MLNEVDVDFLTVTSFHEFGDVMQFVGTLNGVRRETTRMQYIGESTHTELGSAFVGAATQRGRTHNMATFSSRLGAIAFLHLWESINQGRLNITRIDIQKTIELPGDFDAYALYSDIRRNHGNSSLVESDTPTIYIGKRGGEVLTRVYIKRGLGEDKFLRLEFEIKGGKAKSLSRAKRHEIYNYFQWLLKDLRNRYLEELFDASSEPQRLVSLRERGDTEKWFYRVVLPSLQRYLDAKGLEAEHLVHSLAEIVQQYVERLENSLG